MNTYLGLCRFLPVSSSRFRTVLHGGYFHSELNEHTVIFQVVTHTSEWSEPLLACKMVECVTLDPILRNLRLKDMRIEKMMLPSAIQLLTFAFVRVSRVPV